MPDENNPIIYIEYSDEAFPPALWESLKTYALSFNVKNSGILKTPEATLVLKNTGGRYTGNGSLTIEGHKFLRIRADVRDAIDTLFFGRISSPLSGSKKKKAEKLTITARGMTQKLLWDKISKKYLAEQNEGAEDRNMKQVIEHFLANPNTGEASGITLQTDTGDITTVKAKHNFDRQTLLAAINQICEYIGYTGYEEVSGSNINVHLYPYGWQPTNPVITIPASEADRKNILERAFEINLDEIYNHICVWGGAQFAYPDHDRLTENAVSKGYWSASAGAGVADESTIKTVNNKSVKLFRVTAGNSEWTLDLSSEFPSGINVKDKKLENLIFQFYSPLSDGEYGKNEPAFYLEDTDENHIYIQKKGGFGKAYFRTDEWREYSLLVGSLNDQDEWQPPHVTKWEVAPTMGSWNEIENEPFNWIIKKIIVKKLSSPIAVTYYIDGLHFEGVLENDPIKDPSLAATDAASIAAYGRRLMDFDQLIVYNYDAIHLLAEKILQTTKNPLIKLKLKYGAKTWIKPNQIVTVELPVYGITGTPAAKKIFRIVEFMHEWSTRTKLLRTTFGLTQQYLPPDYTIVRPITSREWYSGVLEGIIAGLVW